MRSEYIHLLQSAIADFRRNKVRTFLTSLGITIGVLSVVMLIALGLGLRNYLEQQFENLGANLIIVFPGSVFREGAGPGGNFGAGFAGGAEFDERDVRSLEGVAEIDYVVPLYLKTLLIESKGREAVGYVQGTNEQAFELLNLEVLEGEAFTKSDVQRKSKKGVIGFSLAEDLFETPESAIGEIVRLDGQRITIIGLIKKMGDQQIDTAVIVPYRTTFGNINPDKTFFSINLGVRDEENIEIAKTKAEEVLLKRYDEDDFSVTEQAEILSTVNQIFSIVNSVLVAIGSIALVVGGIGIMNIMYATVTERTKEVGIRRAVGATQRDILLQFLTESVVLSVIGGTLGLIIASLIILIVRQFFPASLNVFAVGVTFVISSAIGIFFGVFPARRAAKLPPIEAIRYE